MKIVFPLYDGFTALDAVGPYEVLSRMPDAEVVFAAVEPGPIRTEGGLTVIADEALRDIKKCDVIVVPGGPGTRAAVLDGQGLVTWLRLVRRTTQWITSVSSGSLILGAAGLLKDLDATTHWSVRRELEATGARFVPERVVFQDGIAMAAGVSAGIDMALRLVARIAGEPAAEAVQLVIEYDPEPPFDSGSLEKASPEAVGFVTEHLSAG